MCARESRLIEATLMGTHNMTFTDRIGKPALEYRDTWLRLSLVDELYVFELSKFYCMGWTQWYISSATSSGLLKTAFYVYSIAIILES